MGIRYFVRANTCNGAVNYSTSNVRESDVVYVVCSDFEYLKSVFLSRITSYMYDSGVDFELWCNPYRKNGCDGFVIPAKSIVIADEKLIDSSDDNVIINLNKCINPQLYKKLLEFQKEADLEILQKYEAVYSVYEGAKAVHDEWESLYISRMDFVMLGKYTDSMIRQMVPRRYIDSKGCVQHRFFGAAYADGCVNYIDNITSEIGHRYFIKGRPGTGKSTFLKKLVAQLSEYGYSCQIYHCGFDPESLDMVVCRELDFCVFDSTSPHEKFPTEDSDVVLDFYENSGLEGTDEDCIHLLTDVRYRYSKLMSLARLYMEEADALCAETEDKIKYEVDFDMLNSLVYDVLYRLI